MRQWSLVWWQRKKTTPERAMLICQEERTWS
jgi:hypothetical protein